MLIKIKEAALQSDDGREIRNREACKMTLPDENNPAWARLVTGKVSRDFELFAIKVLISELKQTFLTQPTEATLRTCSRKLYSFFKNNKNNPRAIADLMKIFN
ncbi:MAG: hypothetical protein JJ895_07120 [Balneolaceae bacterium]|nr:hypothetical protein [Balneolaceae bacterium]